MADDQGDLGKAQTIRAFCCEHVKSIVTLIMILGMVFCIVMIVLVHKWNFEKTHGTDWNVQQQQHTVQSSTTPPVYSYLIHETIDGEDWDTES